MDQTEQQRIHGTLKYQKMLQSLNAELTEIRPGFAEFRIPYNENFTQQNGYFHAGIVTTLADSAGGYAGYTLAAPGYHMLAVEFKVNFLAPAKGEYLIARAEVVKAGKTLTVCKVEVFNLEKGAETMCAIMQQTLISVPISPEMVRES